MLPFSWGILIFPCNILQLYTESRNILYFRWIDYRIVDRRGRVGPKRINVFHCQVNGPKPILVISFQLYLVGIRLPVRRFVIVYFYSCIFLELSNIWIDGSELIMFIQSARLPLPSGGGGEVDLLSHFSSEPSLLGTTASTSGRSQTSRSSRRKNLPLPSQGGDSLDLLGSLTGGASLDYVDDRKSQKSNSKKSSSSRKKLPLPRLG